MEKRFDLRAVQEEMSFAARRRSRKALTAAGLIATALLLFGTGLAKAQAPVQESPSPVIATDSPPPTADTTPDDLGEAGRLAVQSADEIRAGFQLGFMAGIAAIVLAITRALRRFGHYFPGKFGEWFTTPAALWILPIALSIPTALIAAAAAGQPITLVLILSALFSGIAPAAFGNKKAVIDQAEKKGEVARLNVTTPASAVQAFRKAGT